MGFWAWFWIWTALVIASLAVFALIGLELANRGKALARELAKLKPVIDELNEIIEDIPVLADPVNALERDYSELVAERVALSENKKRKHDERQRRLIKHLKDIDPAEKRFK